MIRYGCNLDKDGVPDRRIKRSASDATPITALICSQENY